MTKISQLLQDTTPIATDYVAIVDSTNNITKRITMQDLSSIMRTLLMPSGMIMEFGGSTSPSGWLTCDGSAVSRSTYAALFAAIGTAYGTGDGSTTFNLPDFRGRVPVGKNASDTDFQNLGQTGGQKDVKAHTHTFKWRVNFPRGTGGLSTNDLGGDAILVSDNMPGGDTTTGYDWSGGANGNNSTGTGTTNMNPYQIVNFIIKT